MSQENVELFYKAVDGYNRRDIGPVLETSHPEAEWYPFTAQVDTGARLGGGFKLKVSCQIGGGRLRIEGVDA